MTILKHCSEFLNLAARDLIGTHLAYKTILRSVNRWVNPHKYVPALGNEGVMHAHAHIHVFLWAKGHAYVWMYSKPNKLQLTVCTQGCG